MRTFLLLAGFCYHYGTAVRLGVSEDMDKSMSQERPGPAVDGEGNNLLVMPTVNVKCEVLLTHQNAKFKEEVDSNYMKLKSWPSMVHMYGANWYEGAQPYWTAQADDHSRSFETAHYPVFSQDVQFYVKISQDDQSTKKSQVVAEYWNIPARRMYLFVIGSVDKQKDDDEDYNKWETKEACSGDTKITYRYIIDIFLTGDDLTEWPHTDINMGDYPVIGHEDSTINARRSDFEMEGSILDLMERAGHRKMAFWILDATYVDYLDLVIHDNAEPTALPADQLSKPEKIADEARDIENKLIKGTFWAAFERCREDVEEQRNFFGKPVSKMSDRGVYWVTGVEEGSTPEHVFTGVKYNGAEKASAFGTIVGQRTINHGPQFLFDTWTYNSPTDEGKLVQRNIPIVACGLFPKAVKQWGYCPVKKAEKEG